MRLSRATLPWLALSGLLMVVDGVAAQTASVSGSVRDGGIPLVNAAIYLVPLTDTDPVPPESRVSIDQAHLRFVPSVVVVPPGTEVSFMNSDDVPHNVFGPGGAVGHKFDLGTYERTGSKIEIFQKEGVHIVLCHIHPEMAAYVIVAPTPYKGVTAADGTWSIADVPPGHYRLHAWHSRWWRDEFTQDVVVAESGLSGLVVTLGANRSMRRR